MPKKLEKIKKILGEAQNETETITIDDDGEEVKDKEGIEDAKTGDAIWINLLNKTLANALPKIERIII